MKSMIAMLAIKRTVFLGMTTLSFGLPHAGQAPDKRHEVASIARMIPGKIC
jgi:hypothetical protein